MALLEFACVERASLVENTHAMSTDEPRNSADCEETPLAEC